MNQTIEFEVPGPRPGWQRTGQRNMHRRTITFTPPKLRAAEATVSQLAAQAMRGRQIMLGPVQLSIWIYKIAPPSWSKKKRAAARWVTGKPDSSNQLKLIEDAMNRIVYLDDSQIAKLLVSRSYSDREYTFVRIETLSEQAT